MSNPQPFQLPSLAELDAQDQQRQREEPSDSLGYMSGLKNSFWSSFSSEMWALGADPEAQAFRLENPVMGTVSQIGGYMAGYGSLAMPIGWLGRSATVGRALPKGLNALGQWMNRTNAVEGSVGEAAMQAFKFALLEETAVAAGTPVVQGLHEMLADERRDIDWGQFVLDKAIGLVAAPALTAAFKAVGNKIALDGIATSSLTPDNSPQKNLAKLLEFEQRGTGNLTGEAQLKIDSAITQLRREIETKTRQDTGYLEGIGDLVDASGKIVADEQRRVRTGFHQIFQEQSVRGGFGERSGKHVATLANTPDDLKRTYLYGSDNQPGRAGIHPQFHAFTDDIRMIAFKGQHGAHKTFLKELQGTLGAKNFGDPRRDFPTWVTKYGTDEDNPLYLVVKQLRGVRPKWDQAAGKFMPRAMQRGDTLDVAASTGGDDLYMAFRTHDLRVVNWFRDQHEIAALTYGRTDPYMALKTFDPLPVSRLDGNELGSVTKPRVLSDQAVNKRYDTDLLNSSIERRRLIDELQKSGAFSEAEIAASRGTAIAEFVTRPLKGLGETPVGKGWASLSDTMARAIRRNITPTAIQASKSPLTRQLYQSARSIFTETHSALRGYLAGHAEDVANSRVIFGMDQADWGLLAKAQDDFWTDSRMKDLQRVFFEAPDAEALERMPIAPEVKDWVKRYMDMDTAMTGYLNAAMMRNGRGEFRSLRNRVYFTHAFQGDLRQEISVLVPNKSGGYTDRLVAVSTGSEVKQIKNRTERILAKLAEDAQIPKGDIKVGNVMKRSDLMDDLDLSKKIFGTERAIRAGETPGYLRDLLHHRSGVRGYTFDPLLDEPMKFADVARIIDQHYTKMANDITLENFQYIHGADMLRLMTEDPEGWGIISRYVTGLAGQVGPVNAAISKTLDPILEPVTGKNGAMKLAGAINSTLFQWTLGFGNLRFVAMNLLTPLQTALPEMVYLAQLGQTAPSNLLKYMSFQAVPDSGMKLRPVGVMNGMKIMGQSLRDLWKPSKEMNALVAMARRDGVIDPKFLDEFYGDNAKNSITGALKDGDFVKAIMEVSKFLPSASERFSRLWAYTMGARFARDFAYGGKFTGDNMEAIHHLATQFTERTMYLYSQPDRARVITGPVGGTFGLFKNWMMNYTGQTLRYAGNMDKGGTKALLTQQAMVGASGGAAAMTGYGVADGLSRLMTDDSLMENIYEAFGDEDGSTLWGDMVYMGLPGLLNTSLTSASAAPGANFGRDLEFFFNSIVIDKALKAGTAFRESLDAYSTTGRNPFASDTVALQWAGALAPSTMARAIAGMDGEYRSLNSGYPVTEISTWQNVKNALGFTDRELALSYEVANELWDNQNKLRQRVTSFGKALYEAERAGEWDEYNVLLRAVILQGLPVDSVIRSAKTRLDKDNTYATERNFDYMESLLLRSKMGLVP